MNILKPEYAKQLACMMTGMRWKNMADGKLVTQGRSHADNWGDSKTTSEMMDKYLDQALEIMDSVPSELVIILKSNDLIRCLENSLTKNTTPENYVNMAYLCIQGMKKIELQDALNSFEVLSVHSRYIKSLSVLFLVKSYFYFKSMLKERYDRYNTFFRKYLFGKKFVTEKYHNIVRI